MPSFCSRSTPQASRVVHFVHVSYSREREGSVQDTAGEKAAEFKVDMAMSLTLWAKNVATASVACSVPE